MRRNSMNTTNPGGIAAASDSTSIREQDISLVTAMGFSRSQAIEALLRHKDVNDAVNELLGQS